VPLHRLAALLLGGEVADTSDRFAVDAALEGHRYESTIPA
jgi:hypothetical protein